MKTILLTLAFASVSNTYAMTPELNSGEVKITYPCEIVDSLSKEKEETEVISFFEKEDKAIYGAGYVIRRRVSEKEEDFTLKYRVTGEEILELDDGSYEKLSASEAGEFKCELDLTYGTEAYKTARSCSFKSEGMDLVPEHLEFTEMFHHPLNIWDKTLESLQEIQVQSSSWKFKLTSDQKKANPFTKKPSIERWVARGECKLEVSGKFEVEAQAEVDAKAREGFDFLKSLVPGEPSAEQGNKTAWALGL